jgi:hypothetical protein
MTQIKSWKAKVGDHLHVRTKLMMGGKWQSYIKSGKVVASERHDPRDTFRLHTGNPQYPVSLVSYDCVTGIKLRKGAA